MSVLEDKADIRGTNRGGGNRISKITGTWMIPLHIGISLAVLIGYIKCAAPIHANGYLGYKLYYTLTRILALHMDRVALVSVCAAYLLFLAWRLISRRRLNLRMPRIISFVTTSLLIAFLGINCLAAVLHAGNVSANESRPNVVLIVVDTLRSDHLGCYGYTRKTTPNIDRLANDGIRFEKAIAQAPWTGWSIGSFLTSKYPETMALGVHNDFYPMQDRHLTFAEILKDRGYRTSAVVSNNFLYKKYRFTQGYDFYDDAPVDSGASSAIVTSRAIGQLRSLAGDRFFLTVHYMRPHAPYNLHKRYNFYPGYKGRKRGPIQIVGWDELASFTSDDLKFVRSLYDSELAFTDHQIGKLLDELKITGLYENTIVILVADHGEEFMDHGHCHHEHTLYRELLNVPCIVKLPGIERSRVVGGIFPLVNLLPSVLRSIGIDTSSYRQDGRALDLATVRKCSDRYVYSAIDGVWKNNWPISLRCIQNERYKLILNLFDRTEMLFDHAADPTEQHNIIDKKPACLDTLRSLLMSHNRRMDKAAIPIRPSRAVKLSNEEKERLRTLGYAQ